MRNSNDIAIIGYGETPVVFRSGRSSYDLAAEVLEQIVLQTGIEPSDIDGVAIADSISETGNPFWGVYVCEHLGLSPSWLQTNGLGGASMVGGIARAASAIRDGLCETVLVLATDAQSSGSASEYGAHRPEFQYPMGLMGPVGAFGLISQRYRYQYGLNDKALAKIAVTQRQHALLNPNGCSKLQKQMSESDYLDSRYISEPVRMLDSVMVCDGANGILVTSTENAKRLGAKKMVHPTGYGEITNYNIREQLADITETGFTVAAPRAFSQAKLSPKDIRMVHIYDDFSIAVMLTLEQTGFCARGSGADFILSTDLSFAGELPLNTSGGQLSAGQPGLAGGGLIAVEAVRQLFEEGGDRQVSNPKNAMVTGIGAIPYGRNWAVSNVMILEQA